MKYTSFYYLLTLIAVISAFARNINLQARASETKAHRLGDATTDCGVAITKYSSCITPLLKLSENSSELKNIISNIKDKCKTYQKPECQDVYKNPGNVLVGCNDDKIKEFTDVFQLYTPIMDILCVTDEDGNSCPVNELILKYLSNEVTSELASPFITTTKSKREEKSPNTKSDDISKKATPTSTTTDSEVSSETKFFNNIHFDDEFSDKVEKNCYSKKCREVTLSFFELIKNQVPKMDDDTLYNIDSESQLLKHDKCSVDDDHIIVGSSAPNSNLNSTNDDDSNSDIKSNASSMKFMYHNLNTFYFFFIVILLVLKV